MVDVVGGALDSRLVEIKWLGDTEGEGFWKPLEAAEMVEGNLSDGIEESACIVSSQETGNGECTDDVHKSGLEY